MIILCSKTTNEVVCNYYTYSSITQVNPIELEHHNAYIIDAYPSIDIPAGKSVIWYHDGFVLSYVLVDLPPIQPTSDERLTELEFKNTALENRLTDTQLELTNTEVALTNTEVALTEIYEIILGGQI